jgi:hypothetical protein
MNKQQSSSVEGGDETFAIIQLSSALQWEILTCIIWQAVEGDGNYSI